MFGNLGVYWVAKDMQQSWVSHNFDSFGIRPKGRFFKNFDNFNSTPEDDFVAENIMRYCIAMWQFWGKLPNSNL